MTLTALLVGLPQFPREHALNTAAGEPLIQLAPRRRAEVATTPEIG